MLLQKDFEHIEVPVKASEPYTIKFGRDIMTKSVILDTQTSNGT